MSDISTARIQESDDPLYTDLRLSIGSNNMQHVVLLLDGGAGVNNPDRHGRTLLMWAAVGGDVRFLRLLVERGADLDTVCLSGHTALEPVMNLEDKIVVDVIPTLSKRCCR
jgi:ankyrin repeat protein